MRQRCERPFVSQFRPRLRPAEPKRLAINRGASWGERLSARGVDLKKVAVGFLVVYGLLWLGGRWAVSYTSKCVRSHTVVTVDPQGDEHEDQVRDYSVPNGRHWTILGPVHWLIGR
jgi:hypothetical protein